MLLKHDWVAAQCTHVSIFPEPSEKRRVALTARSRLLALLRQNLFFDLWSLMAEK